MKFTFSLLLTSLFVTGLWAQPVNDECATLIDLGIVPSCESTTYTSVDATTSDLGTNNVPSCFNNGVTLRDVFFTFTPNTDITDYTIRVQGVASGPNGRPLTNPQFTLYRGADCTALSEVVCAAADPGATVVSAVVPIPLTAGTNYFLRINDYANSAAPNWGDFTICIEEYVAPIIMGTVPNTSRCAGTVFDSGGDTDDYGNNLNQTLTICPTEAHECIIFDVERFGIIGPDVLHIYAGNGTGGELIASLNGTSNGEDFRISVNSTDCATLEFISDQVNADEGFILNWECSATPCGSSLDNPSRIAAIPFSGNFSTCNNGATFNQTTCLEAPFLNGPEHVFVYEAPGGSCADIELINAEPGTGIVILDAPPTDPNANCVRVSTIGNIRGADFQIAGTYYIVVANPFGCTNFGLRLSEGPCTTATTLVDALCNPLNGCIQDGDLTTTFRFQDDNQDLVLNEQNEGCWDGVGTQADFFWFTIQAQADGPFGFILQSSNVPSDIDFNVWGPFTEEEVCENTEDVIDRITNGAPIRSSYAGGTEPTGLADIHPEFGYVVEDNYDCEGINDDIVRTIAARQGDVYVVLVNDWGDQILDGAIQVDWSPSDPPVLDPIELEIVAGDTSVCANQPVPIIVETRIDNIRWIGDNITELSCTDCFTPIATPSQTTTYQAVLTTECTTDTISVNVEVYDLNAGPDLEACQQSTFEIPAGPDFETASYSWSPPSGLDFSCTDCASPTVTTSTPGIYTVPVVLDAGACRFTDEVIVTVLAGEAPTYEIAQDQSICRGDNVQIGGAFVDGQVYTWSSLPLDPSLVTNTANPTVSPDVTTTYFLTVSNGECPVSLMDSVTITVTQAPLVSIVQQDVTICQGDSVGLSNLIFEDNVSYNWTGAAPISNPNGPGTIVAPTVSGTYTLTASRETCTRSASTDVTVIPSELDLNQADTLLFCLGEAVTLSPTVRPSQATISWNQADVIGNTPTLSPRVSTQYIATLNNGACVRMDTLYIRVDSLPLDMSIMAEPDKDPYCQGELVQLTSPIYDPFDFPSIRFEWEGPGQETADSLYNMVLTTQDTFTYRRTTTNGACTMVDTIRLNVFRNNLSITPANPEICPGESVQLEVSGTAAELGELEWTPADGLSCTDCPNPIATPATTTSYSVTSTFNDCISQPAEVTVRVIEPPVLMLIDDQTVCPGTTLQLNNIMAQAGVSYRWTNNIDPDFSSSVPNLSVDINQTITYTVVADNGCETLTDSVTITVIEDGSLISVSDPLRLCAGESLNLAANVQASGNATFNSFVWLYDGESELGQEATFIATNSGTATFIYQWGVNENEVCGELRQTVEITVDAAPSVDLIPDAVTCFDSGEFFVLNGLDAEPGVSYNWTSPDDETFSSMEAAPEVSPTTTTTYNLEATRGNCVFNDSVTITVIPPASLVVGDNQVVTVEDPVANLTATVEGDGGIGTFEWAVEGSIIGSTAMVDYTVNPIDATLNGPLEGADTAIAFDSS
ncbi:MAG: hypothetical protein D6772_10160, partial [Bacteroidetes bacterium]